MRRATPRHSLQTAYHAAFLSTLSLRRATAQTSRLHLCNSYFYPRSPCGERRPPPRYDLKKSTFLSTLSLRRATPSDTGSGLIDIFLSTLSLRRATAFFYSLTARRQYFYPRSPCGERLEVVQHRIILLGISIHALLAESDYRCGSGYQAGKHFYPRSPCGERPAQHWNSSGR